MGFGIGLWAGWGLGIGLWAGWDWGTDRVGQGRVGRGRGRGRGGLG